MKSIILPTLQLDSTVHVQIKNNSPRECQKEKFRSDDNSDNRVAFANNGLSGILLQDDGALSSYAFIGQDNRFNKNMANYMQLNEKNTITLMYLFTVENKRRKGYAKQLFENLCEYVYDNYSDVDFIILSCSEKNKPLYQSRGGKLHHCIGINSFLRKEGIDADNYFSFSLR